MTPDEASKLSLREAGIYPFEVTDAKPGVSKEKQNPMIALVLRFFDADGGSFSVKDWLVHSDSRWAEKKVYDFAMSAGLAAKYSAGAMTAEDCLGRGGFAMIGIEKGKAKGDGSGNFPDRNTVKYYTTQKPQSGHHSESQPTPGRNTPPASQCNTDKDVPY